MILTVILTVAALLSLAMTVARAGREEQRALPPIRTGPNIFGDIILPDPSDPRWRRKEALGCTISPCAVVCLEFGLVTCCIEHGCRVSGLALNRLHDKDEDMKYVRAVRAGFMARVAMEANESHDPDAVKPEPQLQLPAVK